MEKTDLAEQALTEGTKIVRGILLDYIDFEIFVTKEELDSVANDLATCNIYQIENLISSIFGLDDDSISMLSGAIKESLIINERAGL